MRSFLLWGLLVALWTAGCGGPGALTVAVVSDPQDPHSAAFLRGVQAALQEARGQEGASRVQTVELRPQELARRLAEVSVVLAGPMDLSDLRALLVLCETQKKPVIVGANHTLDLAPFPQAWRVPINGDYLANAAVFFAVKMLKKERLAAVGDRENPESRLMLADLRRYLKAYRVKDSLRVLSPQVLQDRRGLRRWLRKTRPQVVFLVLEPEAADSALARLREAGFRGAVVGFHEWVPQNPRGAVYRVTDFCAAAPEVQPFVQKYSQATGTIPGLCDALGYDAMNLILAVARQLETPSPEYFMARLRTVEVPGVTGRLEYGTSHDPLGKRPYIVQYTSEGVKVVARPAVSPFR